jgi:hypothetical protein
VRGESVDLDWRGSWRPKGLQWDGFPRCFQHKELATDDPTHDHEIYRSGKYVRFYKLRSKNLPSGTFLRGSDALRAHSPRFAHWLNPADLYASLRYGSPA